MRSPLPHIPEACFYFPFPLRKGGRGTGSRARRGAGRRGVPGRPPGRGRDASASALLARDGAVGCGRIGRRRRRESPVGIAWDPFRKAPLPLACAGCAEPSLSFHACDAAGHLTCAACAASRRRVMEIGRAHV